MRARFLFLLALASLPLYADFVEIKDKANLPLLNEDFKRQTRAKIRLSNGLEALLISDPRADQSAAGLAVGAGSWNDPKEFPGMAHFCEHMLVVGGSKRFPGENEFSKLISDHQGFRNASTYPDRTLYFFSSNHDAFPTILERFSRFFIDPLFDPSLLSRELHAVDHEFANACKSDDRRLYMVFKETGNPDHPNAQFATGNAQTLSAIPQETLRAWFKEHYVAEKMHLVLYSSKTLDEMKKMADSLFSEVQTHETPQMKWKPLFSKEQMGHIATITPVEERQTLELSWELPKELCDNPHSLQLLAYIINRGHDTSLSELLKREGVVNWVEASTFQTEGNLLFQISMDLTSTGLKQVDTAILRCFQALSSLQKSGIPPEYNEEKNGVARLKYQYQERGTAFDEVAIVHDLLDEPLETFPKKMLFAGDYDHMHLAKVFASLTPESCFITLLADPEKTGVQTDRKEQWMGIAYAVRPLAEDLLKQCREAKPYPECMLPDPNPFLPSTLALVEKEGGLPRKIAEDESGIAYYYPCTEFAVPEVLLSLRIRTPTIRNAPLERILALLYYQAFEEQFHTVSDSASAANLHFSLSTADYITAEVKGFSDKAFLYFNKCVKKLTTLKLPTSEQFERYREVLCRKLQDQLKLLAVKRADHLFDAVLSPADPTTEQLLEQLGSITEEQYAHFQAHLFDEVYLEGFFSGNLTEADAKSFWNGITGQFPQSPYKKELHPKKRTYLFPSESLLIRETKKGAFGNAAYLAIDQGAYSFERQAAQQILADVLDSAFFDELRTKQNTGYIAQSFCNLDDLLLTQRFVVQSSTHQPEELLRRFELFLEKTLLNFKEIVPVSRFEMLKQNLLEVLRTGMSNFVEQSTYYNSLIMYRDGDFDWLNKRIEGVESLTYDRFIEEVGGFLSRSNTKRVAILVEGS